MCKYNKQVAMKLTFMLPRGWTLSVLELPLALLSDQNGDGFPLNLLWIKLGHDPLKDDSCAVLQFYTPNYHGDYHLFLH